MQYSVQPSAKVPRKTAEGKEIHYSNFFLTINTNIHPGSSAEATYLGYVCHTAAQDFWQKQNFLQVINKKDPDTKLLKVDIGPWGVELSPTQQRVHVHAFVKIVHDGIVQLDIPEIQKVFLSLWPKSSLVPLGSVAVHVKWVSAQAEMLARYVSKQAV